MPSSRQKRKRVETSETASRRRKDAVNPEPDSETTQDEVEAPLSVPTPPQVPETTITKTRIRAFLAHRKVLLNRIQQSVVACKNRLDAAPSAETDEQEIATHASRIKQANTVQRKRAEPEQRKTISLRKGADVGRKMNAALSTLSSGVDAPLSPMAKRSSMSSSSSPLPPPPTQSTFRRTLGICPEADALRDRKHKIARRLSRIRPPVVLPWRRQTAWDTLLQEMQWMATDFHQERVWKQACGKALSLEMAEKFAKDDEPMVVEEPIAEEEESKVEEPPPPPVKKRGRRKKKGEEELPPKKADPFVKKPTYPAVSPQDTEQTKEVAKRLSQSVGFGAQQLTKKPVVPPLPEEPARPTLTAEEKQEQDAAIVTRLQEIQSHPNKSDTDLEISLAHWKGRGVGVRLCGSIASGKTVACCQTFLTGGGSHLILCESSRVIRWRCEIVKHSAIDRNFIFIMGTDPVEVETLESDCAIICNFESLQELPSVSFKTCLVDARQSCGFEGSHTYPCTKTDATSLLSSPSWWKCLCDKIDSKTERLLLENAHPRYFPRNEKVTKEALEVLAYRIALLLGNPLLGSANAAYMLLQWARRKAKKESASAAKTKLLESVWTELLQLPSVLTVTVGSGLSVDRSVLGQDQLIWRTRACAMSSSQRQAYRGYCREVQSILARGLHCCSNHSSIVCATLMRLRYLCSHADIEGCVRRCSKLLSSGDAIRTSYRTNLSQGFSELASLILDGSGKFQELVSILVNECDVDDFDDLRLDALLPKNQPPEVARGKRGKKSHKFRRIVILAALPALQLMISVLLNHLRVSYRLVSSSSGLSDAKTRARTKDWNEDQKFLAAFCDSDDSSCQVVVGSAVDLGGDHGGLTADAADLIVLMDEDWSGRSELLHYSLILRSIRKRELQGKDPCHAIRLVAVQSCEEEFLGRSSPQSDQLASNGVSTVVDSMGYLDLAVSESVKPRTEISMPASNVTKVFSYPALTVLSHCNRDLPGVLSITELTPGLLLSSSRRFLPRSAAAILKSPVDASFLRALVSEEVKSSMEIPTVKTNEALGDVDDLAIFRYLRSVVAVAAEEAPAMSLTSPALDGDVAEDGVTSIPLINADRGQTDLKNQSPRLLLFYDHATDVDRIKSWSRPNSFATSFERQVDIIQQYDGNTSKEPLVYVPPLFPRVRESSLVAKTSLTPGNAQSLSQGSKKRHAEDGATNDQKRLKLEDNGTVGSVAAGNDDEAPELVEADRPDDFGMAGSGAISLPRDSALSAAYTQLPVSVDPTESNWFSTLEPLDYEDWQRPSTSSFTGPMVLFVTRKRTRGGYGSGNRGRSSLSLAGFPLVQDDGLDLDMVDVAGRRSRDRDDDDDFSAFDRIPHVDPNYGREAAAARTRDTYRRTLLTTMRQTGLGSTLFESAHFRSTMVRVKNRVESRLLRHSWTSTTTFEVGPGLPTHVNKPRPGGRFPFEVDPKPWTSLAKRLADGDLSHMVLTAAAKQEAAFRKSYTMPCRCDFGPFNVGFLSSTTGMTAAALPRARIGVSLPMGVKVTALNSDQTLPSWNDDYDSQLINSLKKYGYNWQAVARSVRGMPIFPNPKSTALGTARLCRERWQQISRNDQVVAKDVTDTIEQWLGVYVNNYDVFSSESTEEAETIEAKDYGLVEFKDDEEFTNPTPKRTFLVPTSVLNESTSQDAKPKQTSSKDIDPKQPQDTADEMEVDQAEDKKEKPLSPWARAKAKLDQQKITIPGVTPGASGASAASSSSSSSQQPSHPSHLQAIQNVVLPGAAPRKDMWPLQILAQRTSATAKKQQQSSSPARPSSSSFQPPSAAQQKASTTSSSPRKTG